MRAYRDAGFRVDGPFRFPQAIHLRQRYLRYQHECAHLLVKGNPKVPAETIGDVIDWTYSGTKLHPTQKPLSLLLPLVETFSAPQHTVLDPFSGSGSSLLAAKCSDAVTSESNWMPSITPLRRGDSKRDTEVALAPQAVAAE
jgi:site-specific DNA-methyltransferase (adenine-specific)